MSAPSASALAAALAGIEVTVASKTRTMPVHGEAPDRFTPPAIVVQPDEPWIDNAEGLPAGVMEFNYRVRCIAGQGTGVAQQDVLLYVVTAVMTRLHASQIWTAGAATAPFQLATENSTYLSADITVSALGHITEE